MQWVLNYSFYIVVFYSYGCWLSGSARLVCLVQLELISNKSGFPTSKHFNILKKL